MNAPTAPKRRWFRFGLRSMFVAVTIGCWLGWQVYVVHQRKQFVEELQRQSLASIIMTNVAVFGTYETLQKAPSLDPQVPFFRRWLGDRARPNIGVESMEQAEVAMRWFPESTVHLYTQTSPMPRKS